MKIAKRQARDWAAFTARWKRHRKPHVRIGPSTWRARPWCFEKGENCNSTLTLFPDGSGGYKVCSKCHYVEGVGEY